MIRNPLRRRHPLVLSEDGTWHRRKAEALLRRQVWDESQSQAQVRLLNAQVHATLALLDALAGESPHVADAQVFPHLPGFASGLADGAS